MHINKQDITFWSQKAESFFNSKAQGKSTLSVEEVASLFMKEKVHVDISVIDNIAGEDKQVDKNELAMLLYMLDGTKKYDVNDESQYSVKHDWFIETNGYKQGRGMTVFDYGENDPLKDTLANTATPEEFAEIQKAFGIKGKPQFGLNAESQKASDSQYQSEGIMKTIADENYQAKLESDVDKILNGKESIKVSEFKKSEAFKAIKKQFESGEGRSKFLKVATQDESISDDMQGITSMDNIELSRNELKTILMVADANLVKISGKEKFVFDSKYVESETGGIKEMSFEELEQIYMIMGIHSIAGKEGVATFIKNNS